jgi:hypothetical protein
MQFLMMNQFKKLIFLLAISLMGCQAKSQVYTDLNDYGYKGKIKSITTKFYSNIVQEKDKWEIQDTLTPGTIISNYFNGDGNFTRKIVTLQNISYQLIYDYSDRIKKGWKKIDSNGVVSEVGKYTYHGNTGFSEISFDTIGTKKFRSNYIFNKSQRTKTLEDIGYNEDGSTNFHSFSTFDDDAEGHLHKLTTIDKLNKTTENIEFIILEKDKHNNPLKILLFRNSKPVEIRKVTIEYE